MTIKKDNLRFGILLGLISPLLGAVIFYLVKFFPTFSIKEFLSAVVQNKSLLTAVSSASLLTNVIVFTYYLNHQLDRTAKGIFLISCIYILTVIVYKLL